MDFLKIVQSIEEFLYEVMTWIVFYPRTMWLAVSQPLWIMDYSDREQADAPEQQYTDTLSPPLFLMISILIAHGVELVAHARLDGMNRLAQQMFGSDQTLLLMRAVIFAIYPLMFAASVLRRSGRPLDRISLRAPFFNQCYTVAPVALLMGFASVATRLPDPGVYLIGVVANVAAVIWYIVIQSLWLHRRLGISRLRALWTALWIFALTSVVILMVLALLFL